MKLRIVYTEQFEIEVDSKDIAHQLLEFDGDEITDASKVADEKISKVIGEWVDSTITDREWPSYRIERRENLIPEVRKQLKKLLKAGA